MEHVEEILSEENGNSCSLDIEALWLMCFTNDKQTRYINVRVKQMKEFAVLASEHKEKHDQDTTEILAEILAFDASNDVNPRKNTREDDQ